MQISTKVSHIPNEIRIYNIGKENTKNEKTVYSVKLRMGRSHQPLSIEDEKFRVILDLGPATKGHALILPKSHYENLYELPDALAGEAMVLAKKSYYGDERCFKL